MMDDAMRAISYFCAGLGVGVLLMILDELARMVSRYKQVRRDVERYRREMLTTYERRARR